MTHWRTLAHHAAPPPPDWRERLAARLGQRPRRVGVWAELALHGALQCLEDADEPSLPGGAFLCVASERGAESATRAAIEQLGQGLPLPFSFLQSQPSQMLAALCQHLHWSGDARFVLSRDPQALLRLAQREAGPAGLLLGWVDEGVPARSEWWRMVPGPAKGTRLAPMGK